MESKNDKERMKRISQILKDAGYDISSKGHTLPDIKGLFKPNNKIKQEQDTRITKWLEPEVIFTPQQVISAGIICASKWWEYRQTNRKPMSNYVWLLTEQERLADKGIQTSIISQGLFG